MFFDPTQCREVQSTTENSSNHSVGLGPKESEPRLPKRQRPQLQSARDVPDQDVARARDEKRGTAPIERGLHDVRRGDGKFPADIAAHQTLHADLGSWSVGTEPGVARSEAKVSAASGDAQQFSADEIPEAESEVRTGASEQVSRPAELDVHSPGSGGAHRPDATR